MPSPQSWGYRYGLLHLAPSWEMGNPTQAFMLTWQALHQLSHMPSIMGIWKVILNLIRLTMKIAHHRASLENDKILGDRDPNGCLDWTFHHESITLPYLCTSQFLLGNQFKSASPLLFPAFKRFPALQSWLTHCCGGKFSLSVLCFFLYLQFIPILFFPEFVKCLVYSI